MKSVGEVMAIGRNFQESLQKALRGLETGITGLNEICGPIVTDLDRDALRQELRIPGSSRILYVADALRHGYSFEDVAQVTGIDPWFLIQIADLVNIENEIREHGLAGLNADIMRAIKRKGFADARIAELVGSDQKTIRNRRIEMGVRPVYKRVDTCAAEFATTTAYMYSSYDEECEADTSDRAKIMILGGGPNRIGQGIEFDYCCVHAALALRESGYETIMVNCNPETVSTDYDTSDRLYFESLTFEDVMEIIDLEKPKGVIVQYGGQTPLKLARDLEEAGAPIIGHVTGLDRPGRRSRALPAAGRRPRSQAAAKPYGEQQGTGTGARVRSGVSAGRAAILRARWARAMEIVHSDEDLAAYMDAAINVSNDSPVLLDRFSRSRDRGGRRLYL